LIGLIYVPLLLDYLDSEIWYLVNMSSILVGLSSLILVWKWIRNKFTEAIANGKHKLARIYVSTTYAILIIFFW